MKHYLKMIRPLDYVIVLLLMLASFIPYAIFAYHEAQQSSTNVTAVVTHDGQAVYRIKLTGHHGVTHFHYRNGDDINEIVVTDETIAITDANCGDQACVRQGKISKPGKTIVCLPHKLLVSIKSSDDTGSSAPGGMVAE